MDRTERLLGLLAGLADAGGPVPFAEIQAWFPDDYDAPSREAAERKFERDKADLVALGVPIEYVDPQGDEDGEGGYRVARDRLFLPPLALSPDEMATVYLAGLALVARPGFPYRGPLATALRKIELASDPQAHARDAVIGRRVLVDHPSPAADEALERATALVGQALEGRKHVTFAYRAQGSGEETRRTADPLGLYCRRGEWILVAHCHLRGAIRSFLVHRMSELAVNTRKPGTPDFAARPDFRLADWVAVPAWRWEVHAPLTVTLEARPDLAWLVAEELAAEGQPGEGGWQRFEVVASNVDALCRFALWMGARARIVAPAEARDRWCAAARAALARHEAA